MTVQFYPNGIGGSAPGDQLDLARPLQTTGNVWYVNFTGGVDAASPAGMNREKPLKTVNRAVANAADDDIIVFLPGHSETLTGTQAVAKRLTFIGEGTTSGKPAVSFISDVPFAAMFTLSTTNIEFRNIYFPEAAQPSVGGKLSWAGARGRLSGCYFEQGANDGAAGVLTTGACDQMRIDSCTFISTATAVASQPYCAFRPGAFSLADLEITNTIVSAGTVGFSNIMSVDLTLATVTRIRVTGLSLLLGGDFGLPAAATGFVNIQQSTGGSRTVWS